MNRSSLMYSWWQQIRQFPWLSVGWLTVGVGVLAASFLLWVSLQLAERVTVEVPVDPAQPAEQIVALPSQLEGDLGMLFESVPALDLSKPVATVGQRAAEFRGTEFIKTNSSNWTLQVMKVSQESVIKTYLTQRKDRNRFQYFRMVEGEQEHYLLTYGNFTTVQTAMGALQTMQFDLPNSVKAFPERFSTYQAAVKDQGSEERMSGMAQKVRQILLKPVAIPVPVDPTIAAAHHSNSSVQEPAFGALAGDRLAEHTDAGSHANPHATEPSARSTRSNPHTPSPNSTPPSEPVAASPAASTNTPNSPTVVQDPFN